MRCCSIVMLSAIIYSAKEEDRVTEKAKHSNCSIHVNSYGNVSIITGVRGHR